MTIVASGEISLGVNATTTRSVACELDRSGTSQICMDETQVRALAARTTAASAICMNDFYGKTSVPTTLGQSYRGGYYTGVVTSPTNYYIVVAPNASGCACCIWNNSANKGIWANTNCAYYNGYWATYTYLTATTDNAGNFARTRSINGFSDWYLPSRNELGLMFTNCGSMPSGQGYGNHNYWTSTEHTYYGTFAGALVYNRQMGTGAESGYNTKNFALGGVRAIRRVPV